MKRVKNNINYNKQELEALKQVRSHFVFLGGLFTIIYAVGSVLSLVKGDIMSGIYIAIFSLGGILLLRYGIQGYYYRTLEKSLTYLQAERFVLIINHLIALPLLFSLFSLFPSLKIVNDLIHKLEQLHENSCSN